MKQISFRPGFILAMLMAACTAFSQPAFQWANDIGGTGYDLAYSIALDGSGNIYVTGTFTGTVDFDPGAGTANLTPTGSSDVFFAKYDPSGNYLWAKNFGGTASFEESKAIAVDASGNAYLTGYYVYTCDFDPGAGTASLTSVSGSWDIYLAKYNSAGNYLWAKSFGGAYAEEGQGLATDASGYVYITGYFRDQFDFDPGAGTTVLVANGTYDIFFARYDASGNFQWAKNMGGAGLNYGYGIEADDASGSVFVTGYFNGTCDFNPDIATTNNLTTSGGADIFFARYDASGNYQWARKIGSGSPDMSYSIALDASANVHIAGYFNGTADFDPGAGTANLTSNGMADAFFAKYNSAGNYLWAKKTGGMDDDVANSIALDGSGNVYVAGNFQYTADFDPGAGTTNYTSAGNTDLFVGKYDPSGNFICAAAIGGIDFESAGGVAVDASANIHLTGYNMSTSDFNPDAATTNNLTASAGSQDIFIAKYGQCAVLPVGILNLRAFAGKDIEVRWETASELNSNYFTIEKSNDGVSFEAAGKIEGAGNSSVLHRYVFTDGNASPGMNYYRIRQTDYNGNYSCSGIVIAENTAEKMQLLNNPVAGMLGFRLSCAGVESVQAFVSLSDMLGNQLLNGPVILTPGVSTYKISVDKLPAGLYFISIKAGGCSLQEKFVKE